ncbi:MAG: ABC-type nitrate/sulfonate/bicarbonate transport system periplasmic component-like protein [Rhizobium sp.]|nr:ABC-type nitrate/sulfonate/bicarbonate transport system periplasmic component-like protein [Rhizobium sp.]
MRYARYFACSVACATAMFPALAVGEPTTLRFGVIAASMRLFQSAPIYVAQQKGMFERQDLAVTIVPLPGVEHMINELDKGAVDVSITATPYLVKAALNGSDAVAVVGGPANTIYSIVAKPGISSFDDLRGKTIAMSLPEDMISVTTRLILAKHGLQEANFIAKQLIGTPLRAKCLETEECAAAPLSQPDDIIFARKGFKLLANSHEVIPTMQFTVIAARRSWAGQHKDAVVRFARAIGNAYQFTRDPANRDEVVAIAAKETGTSDEISREIYKLYYEPDLGVMPKHGEISVPGFSKVIELLGSSGMLQKPLPSAGSFIDLQFLEAAGMQ